MVLLIVYLYQCNFLLQIIHIYRTCFSYNEDVPREKQVFHQFLLKSNDCFGGQAEVRISVTIIASPILQSCTLKLLVFNYYCRQKTIFYDSNALNQV